METQGTKQDLMNYCGGKVDRRVLSVLFGGLAAFVLPHTSFAQASSINHGGGSFSTWLVAMGIIFSYPIGWANFASDYSRDFPVETS